MLQLSKDNIHMSIIVGHKEIEIYTDPVTRRATFIEGRKGSDFKIKIVNDNFFRVCVIPSVDGLSTIDGKLATSDSPSYVINSRSELIIPGWTIDNQNISKFEFTDMSKSYSTEMLGTNENVGVIGIMVFKEEQINFSKIFRQVDGPWQEPRYPNLPNISPCWFSHSINNISTTQMSTSSVNTSVASSYPSLTKPDQEKIGVGWGSSENFHVNEVDFKKSTKLCELEIHYDTRKNLEARGIEFNKMKAIRRDLPKAFHFMGCQPPANWKKSNQ